MRGKRVLDVGCAQLPNRFIAAPHLVGVDLMPMADAADNYHEFHQSDVEGYLASEQEGFDTIVAGEFIEHVERPYDVLAAFRGALNPGGRLVLSTPNPVGLPILLFEWLISRRRFYTTDHTFLFSPRWMVRMLERTGFHVTGVWSVGIWAPIPIPCPVGLSYQVIYVAESTVG